MRTMGALGVASNAEEFEHPTSSHLEARRGNTDTHASNLRERVSPHSIACVLVMVSIVAAPTAFGAVQPWAWATLAILVVLVGLFWAFGSARQEVVRLLWIPIFLPAGAFLLLGLIQGWGNLTADRVATREAVLKLTTHLALFFFSVQLLNTNTRTLLRRFGLCTAIFAFSLGLFAILQFLSGDGLIYWTIQPRSGGWVFGPYVNHNHFAGLMELLIPVSAGFVCSRPRDRSLQMLLLFMVLVPIASLLLSGSRGGLVSLCAEILVLGAAILRFAPPKSRRRLATAGVLATASAALLFIWMDPGEVGKRLATVLQPAHAFEASFGQRKAAALDCLRILFQHPGTGTGLGTFATTYPQYRSFATDFEWDHAHNDFTEALAETGLSGGLLILAALGMFVATAFRNLKTRLSEEQGWIELGAALGCIGFLVHSLFDFNFHIPANAAWFAVCAAIACSGPLRSTTLAPQNLITRCPR